MGVCAEAEGGGNATPKTCREKCHLRKTIYETHRQLFQAVSLDQVRPVNGYIRIWAHIGVCIYMFIYICRPQVLLLLPF